MLLDLVIENYAVVDRLRIRFQPGLNLLTGETGSGKSIVVDALGLLLGGRASADSIRSGESRARISGIFTVPEDLRLEDYEIEQGELLVEREILSGGKSRAFVGSRPATAALLRDLAPRLGDIHGQHEQQLLFSTDAQRIMLDTFAGASTAAVRDIYRRWIACSKELETLERTEQEKRPRSAYAPVLGGRSNCSIRSPVMTSDWDGNTRWKIWLNVNGPPWTTKAFA